MTAPKTTWGVGDYPLMGERLEPVAQQAIALAGVGPGMRVLDVGCGTGTFARAAAALGSDALGLDAEPVLLEVARSLDAHGVQWRESDFALLDADDGTFDVVASLFGVMYASDPLAAGRELARVCASHGKVVLTAWTPTSFLPAFGRTVGAFLPPPPASSPPSRWGDRRELVAMLDGAGLEVQATEVDWLLLPFHDVEGASSFVIRTAGHVVAERERLTAEGQWSALERAARFVVEQHVVSTDDGVALPLEYLLALARPTG